MGYLKPGVCLVKPPLRLHYFFAYCGFLVLTEFRIDCEADGYFEYGRDGSIEKISWAGSCFYFEAVPNNTVDESDFSVAILVETFF